MLSSAADDADLVGAINRCTGAGLTVGGRAEFGKAGGAIFVEWPDGHLGVVTIFHGGIADGQRVADVLNHLHEQGLPVPRHELVVDLGDRVVFVQQRLPKGSPGKFGPKRVDGIVEINERFADALTDVPGVPPVSRWFQQDGGDPNELVDLTPARDHRAREVVSEIVRLTTSATSAEHLDGVDLVHVDLSAANVLFDDDEAPTAVVDWNLGVYRGDRRLALVQTRFDREWFVQRSDADANQALAARHLDEILADKIDSDTLRIYWAYWLGHQLPKAFRSGSSRVIDWQLEMAESRLG